MCNGGAIKGRCHKNLRRGSSFGVMKSLGAAFEKSHPGVKGASCSPEMSRAVKSALAQRGMLYALTDQENLKMMKKATGALFLPLGYFAVSYGALRSEAQVMESTTNAMSVIGREGKVVLINRRSSAISG